ncbi:MAG: hypothetical protein MJ072_05660, partial [Clostridia bacterium]|nr:hypothetical protein [Clostridia bacterium]
FDVIISNPPYVTEKEYEGYAKNLISTTELKFEVDNTKSYFKTNLKSNESLDGYVFSTELCVYGTYTYEGITCEVEGDLTKTTTSFKDFKNGFKAVKTEREVENTIPLNANPTSADAFVKVGYKAVIEYGEKAKVQITPNGDTFSQEIYRGINKDNEIKKYDKNNYIDNDLIFLMMRTFKFNSSMSSFNYSFATIDPASGALTSLTAQARNFSAQTQTEDGKGAFNNINCDGNSFPFYDGLYIPRTFTAFGVELSTTGNYAQTIATAYYATDNGSNGGNGRNCPVKIYQKAIYNIGYITYTLSSAVSK